MCKKFLSLAIAVILIVSLGVFAISAIEHEIKTTDTAGKIYFEVPEETQPETVEEIKKEQNGKAPKTATDDNKKTDIKAKVNSAVSSGGNAVKTGQDSWPVYLAIAVMLIAVIAVVVAIVKKKR